MQVTKDTNHIQHVYQHNIVFHHVQWQLPWWLDVSREGKNHMKFFENKKRIGKNKKYGKKKRNIKFFIKKEKKKND
jgi:hypothetical protein